MRYWWANQGETFDEEIDGGYLWSPKCEKDGRKNVTYDNMGLVSPGDVIFSYCDAEIKALGICLHKAVSSEKPTEFGHYKADGNKDGWKVDTEYLKLSKPIRPIEHHSELEKYRTEYFPLNKDGKGNQKLYLPEISAPMAAHLISIIGPEYQDNIDQLQRAFYQVKNEDRALDEIKNDSSTSETEKKQLILARTGQGKFKTAVKRIENKCRITDVNDPEHLIACHIKPWYISTNQERLDGHNGLFFAPHIHHLFDKGYLGINQSGVLQVSQNLSKNVINFWHIPNQKNLGKFMPEQIQYLQYHYDNIFKTQK